MMKKSAQCPSAADRTTAASIIHGIGPQKYASRARSELVFSSAISFGPYRANRLVRLGVRRVRPAMTPVASRRRPAAAPSDPCSASGVAPLPTSGPVAGWYARVRSCAPRSPAGFCLLVVLMLPSSLAVGAVLTAAGHLVASAWRAVCCAASAAADHGSQVTVLAGHRRSPRSPASSSSAVATSACAVISSASHFQLRISGRSWPCLSMYWLCSTSLSCIVCFR